MAYNWGEREKKSQNLRKQDSAVVIFKVDNNPEIFTSRYGKEFFDRDIHEWKQTVKFFRSKKDDSYVGKNKAKDLKRMSYMFGPIADGGIDPRQQLDPRFYGKPKKYQLCLKSQEMADDLYKSGANVEQVIFFDGGQKVMKRRSSSEKNLNRK